MAFSKKRVFIAFGAGFLLAAIAIVFFLCRQEIGSYIDLKRGEMAVSSHRATPLDLSVTINNYGWSADRFAQNTRFPAWTTIPTGFQVLHHVPFQIDGAFALWGENNAKRLHINFPEAITNIPVTGTFDSLYLLHCCFFNEPNHTPVYEVVFRYMDNSSATNQLLFGNDLLDWMTKPKKNGTVQGPNGKNSKLAWVGEPWDPDSKTRARLCLTELTNPTPAIMVSSIDLYSCKSSSAGCILAMTTGKSGLMK